MPFGGYLDDFDVLAPGHLLTGDPATSVSRTSSANDKLDHLTHWTLVQGLRDDLESGLVGFVSISTRFNKE